MVMKLPALTAPTVDLLKVVNKAGIRFRVVGAQIRVTGHVSEELRPVLDALKGRKAEIMAILGATERDQPAINLLASVEVTPIVPVTLEETEALVAALIEDSLK